MSTLSKSLTGKKTRLINSSRAHHLTLTETWEFLAQSSETESFRPATGLSDCVVVRKIESNHHSLRRGTVKVVRRSPATRLFRTPVLFWFLICVCVFFLSFSRESDSANEIKNVYDPSAGSPTETLLRLLLPLKDQVRPSFSLAVGRRRTGRDCSPLDGTPTSPSEGLTKSFNR